MTAAATNARSKELLLAFMDGHIILDRESPRELVHAMIMNRNRVAKFLGLPTRKFNREKGESNGEAK